MRGITKKLKNLVKRGAKVARNIVCCAAFHDEGVEEIQHRPGMAGGKGTMHHPLGSRPATTTQTPDLQEKVTVYRHDHTLTPAESSPSQSRFPDPTSDESLMHTPLLLDSTANSSMARPSEPPTSEVGAESGNHTDHLSFSANPGYNSSMASSEVIPYSFTTSLRPLPSNLTASSDAIPSGHHTQNRSCSSSSVSCRHAVHQRGSRSTDSVGGVSIHSISSQPSSHGSSHTHNSITSSSRGSLGPNNSNADTLQGSSEETEYITQGKRRGNRSSRVLYDFSNPPPGIRGRENEYEYSHYRRRSSAALPAQVDPPRGLFEIEQDEARTEAALTPEMESQLL